MEVYRIISSGSHGNSLLIADSILVDIGVPYSLIKPYQHMIQVVTWSHKHGDHLNKATLSKLLFERPGIRVAVCEHEYQSAVECGARNIDLLEHGKWYDYGRFKIATFKTYHDVPSNGWRIAIDDYKIFIATDTAHLKGVTAQNYTHYLLEFNYNEETVWDIIAREESEGRYAHMRGSINSHLSEQQARKFLYENAREDSVIQRLHETRTVL